MRAWQGLIAPAGLPEPILRRLNTEVVRILKEPATVERLRTFGNEPAPCSPEEFKRRLTADIATWTALADEIHFKRLAQTAKAGCQTRSSRTRTGFAIGLLASTITTTGAYSTNRWHPRQTCMVCRAALGHERGIRRISVSRSYSAKGWAAHC